MALLKHNNQSISNVTSFPLVPSGDMKLLATATASSSASLSFNSTYINGDYQIYKFEFIDMHPSVDGANFAFNMSTDNGSTYAVTKTTTTFRAYQGEGGTPSVLGYSTSLDLAQSTSIATIAESVGFDNDQSASGYLQLFNPSSVVFVKHFISRFQVGHSSELSMDFYGAGYGNTTSAVNSVQFSMNSGNIDAGTIKLYGLGAN